MKRKNADISTPTKAWEDVTTYYCMRLLKTIHTFRSKFMMQELPRNRGAMELLSAASTEDTLTTFHAPTFV